MNKSQKLKTIAEMINPDLYPGLYDEYEFRSVDVYLKGMSVYPSVNSLNKKKSANKKLNKLDKMLDKSLSEMNNLKQLGQIDNLMSIKRDVDKQLKLLRHNIYLNRILMLLSGGFYDQSRLEDTDKGYIFNKEDDIPMIINLSYKLEKTN
jgi:hypothetical protein